LVDSLTVRAGHPGPDRDRGEIVLGPVVGARLLAALMPVWIGSEARGRAVALADRHDRLGSGALTVIDDGGLAGGALAAPVDGEGVPTRRLALVREGRFQQPLLDWRQAEATTSRSVGCVRRPSWRDRPSLGSSHLFIEGDENLAASDLLASVARGYYLLDTLGAVRVDFDSDRFVVPVCGFSLVQGQARDTVARSWLCGGIGALLRGIRAAAQDLSFVPIGSMVGAPSLLTNGLELRREL
jgi:predicted Zn-dependent protease